MTTAPKNDAAAKRDHELTDVRDFGEVAFDPNNQASTEAEQDQLDAERFYQARDDKPSPKQAPGGAGNPERPSNPD